MRDVRNAYHSEKCSEDELLRCSFVVSGDFDKNEFFKYRFFGVKIQILLTNSSKCEINIIVRHIT